RNSVHNSSGTNRSTRTVMYDSTSDHTIRNDVLVTSQPTPPLMTPFEADMFFESTVPADRVSSMRSVILPDPEAEAIIFLPHLVPAERTLCNRLIPPPMPGVAGLVMLGLCPSAESACAEPVATSVLAATATIASPYLAP
ncbi:hypothetical protein, partial [Streptomyces sp. NPDC088794]|uniref:hypothetical protein n=1 Tax=Streptomyces sp. NPDC088794 TaxID=3365902 RepID=UPI00382485E5